MKSKKNMAQPDKQPPWVICGDDLQPRAAPANIVAGISIHITPESLFTGPISLGLDTI